MVLAHGRHRCRVSTQKQALQLQSGTRTPGTRAIYLQKTITLCFTRNIPAVAAAWVLRPNVRPVARKSARMVNMVLLGCCVSGAGCVVLDRLALSSKTYLDIFSCKGPGNNLLPSISSASRNPNFLGIGSHPLFASFNAHRWCCCGKEPRYGGAERVWAAVVSMWVGLTLALCLERSKRPFMTCNVFPPQVQNRSLLRCVFPPASRSAERACLWCARHGGEGRSKVALRGAAYSTTRSGSSSAEEASVHTRQGGIPSTPTLYGTAPPCFPSLYPIRVGCVVSSLLLCAFCRTDRGWKGSLCCSSKHGSASSKRHAPASSPLLVRLPSGSAALYADCCRCTVCAWESADTPSPEVAWVAGVRRAAFYYVMCGSNACCGTVNAQPFLPRRARVSR